MTLVVPIDGSELARSALARAGSFAAVVEKAVVAVTVISERNAEYAATRGWIERGAECDLQAVLRTLREQVSTACPDATFRHETVDHYAPVGTIKNRIRRVIRDVDASMTFIGSGNAGRMVTALSSVGGGIATDDAYDVVIVRHAGRRRWRHCSRSHRLATATADGTRNDAESSGRTYRENRRQPRAQEADSFLRAR